MADDFYIDRIKVWHVEGNLSSSQSFTVPNLRPKQPIVLKQSVEALATRVSRKAEEYSRSGVDLWICASGTAHVLPMILHSSLQKSVKTDCEFIGHYQHPCSYRDIIEDIEWILRKPVC